MQKTCQKGRIAEIGNPYWLVLELGPSVAVRVSENLTPVIQHPHSLRNCVILLTGA